MRCIFMMSLAMTMVPLSASAQETTDKPFVWKVGDKAETPDPSWATEGDFAVRLFVTADYEGFWKAWEGPTPPHLSVTDMVQRGKPVHAMIVFAGCKPNVKDKCDLTVDYSITGPDALAYGNPVSAKVWDGPPAPDQNLQLSEASLGLVIEPQDALGRYTFKARVTDHVTGISLQVEKAVNAVEPLEN